jgi:hypothetical protein
LNEILAFHRVFLREMDGVLEELKCPGCLSFATMTCAGAELAFRGRGPPVCSQNRIRCKSVWGHGDLPQKPRFS